MNSSDLRQVLSNVRSGEFFGRDSQLDRLCALAEGPLSGNMPAGNMLVIGPPRVGKTELLRKAFDRLFQGPGPSAPIYYALNSNILEAEEFSADFLVQFLVQFIAFRRKDAQILRDVYDSPTRVLRMAGSEDYPWISRVIDSFTRAASAGDARTMLKTALSAPYVACLNSGLGALVMMDDFDRLAEDDCSRLLRSELGSHCLMTNQQIAPESESPSLFPVHVICGLRRPVLDLIPAERGAFEALDILRIDPLSEQALEQMIAAISSRVGVQISDSTTELMIQQLGRDLFYIRSLLQAASSHNLSLKSFMDFERLYTDELMEGRIGLYFDAMLKGVATDLPSRRAALEVLNLVTAAEANVPIQAVIEQTFGERGFGEQTEDAASSGEELLRKLDAKELIEMRLGSIRRVEDPVLADYVRCRYRDEIAGAPRPLAGHHLLSEKLKTSYRLMMSRYNRAVETQLVEILLRFDFQSIPASLFDPSSFEDLYSGASRVQARRALDDEKDRIRLPQVVFVSDLGSGDGPGLSCRILGAHGFEGGVYSEANEVGWLIALVNSKEPLDQDAIRFIDERTTAGAQTWMREQPRRTWTEPRSAIPGAQVPRGPAARVVRWYISKEGFAPSTAHQTLGPSVYRSTYSQLDLIHDYLIKLSRPAGESKTDTEFELVIPVEEDAELIAARTVEQIARGADFSQEAINQIKTALIEACLNAAEHGDSPDRRIFQRFVLTENGLVITVSNRGARFDESMLQTAEVSSSPKRGRGLQIIRALMDEVRFERTDDGANLVMTKFLKQQQAAAKQQ
jgi:serine/threonine-protein kinase RsbW